MAESWEIVGDVVGGVAGGVVRGVGAVAKLFDGGEPGENDQGSCHWPGWEHEAICSMLNTTVDPGDVHEGARVWNDQRLWAEDIVKRLTDDLRGTVSNGWRGGSADAAITSLEPVDRWSASQSDAAEHTGRLLDDSGYAAGQAKATVPPAIDYDFRRTGISLVKGGFFGVGLDAIAQDHAQEEARREAVRIMNNVYSAPIKDNRAAVPTYPQLIDPTLQPPEPSPVGGPTPGSGLPRGDSGIPVGGGVPGGGTPYQPPAAVGLQSADAGSVDGGHFESAQSTGPQQTGRGQGYGSPGYPGQGGQGLGAAAAAVPFMPPMAGGGEQERARRGFRSAGPPGGRGGGGYPGGHPSGGRGGDFGPRGSNPGAAAAAGEGRAGPGAAGAAGGRGGGGGAPGGVPVGGAGGRGQGGEDTEHRRPSYLIEMNDIFNDGRKVAPPVIGVDLPEDHR